MDHPLAKERYVQLTTYRRNGDAVSNPMWIAPSGDRLYMLTDGSSPKVKRLRNNPAVELVASDMRGRPKSGAEHYRGTAELLDEEGTATARSAYERKYPPLAQAIGLSVWLQRTILRRQTQRVGIAIDLEE